MFSGNLIKYDGLNVIIRGNDLFFKQLLIIDGKIRFSSCFGPYTKKNLKMIEGNFTGGKEDGKITEWYHDGSIKSEKFYNGGAIDAAKTVKYEPKNEIKEVKPDPNAKKSEVVDVSEVEERGSSVEASKTGTTKTVVRKSLEDIRNGDHVLYNRNKQVSQKGFFKDGRLWNGKWYRYDENGILRTIEIYKDGRYVGDGVIED